MKSRGLAQAFTIIELTTVMVIMMIIASLIVGVGRKARISAMEAKAKSMIASLEVAISMYHADTGNYPPTDGGSGSANLYDHLTNETDYGPGGSSEIDGWRGPYMEFKSKDLMGTTPDQIKDPWGNAYNYKTLGTYNTKSFDLWSDGYKAGTADDITNW